jgi:hypothetical protein
MSDIEMDTTEFVRFMDEDYENMACSYDDNGAAHLTRCTNVAFSSTTMYRLQHVGLGPTLRHSRFSNSKARDQWLSHVFGLDEAQAELFPVPTPKGSAPSAAPWLYVAAQGPNADYVLDHMIAWGASVIGPVDTALKAAQIASHEDLAGAVLEVYWNIEAPFVISDVLLRRRIPYIVIAREIDPPASMAAGGKILRGWVSMGEIRHALETLPQRATVGMDLSREVNIEWGRP